MSSITHCKGKDKGQCKVKYENEKWNVGDWGPLPFCIEMWSARCIAWLSGDVNPKNVKCMAEWLNCWVAEWMNEHTKTNKQFVVIKWFFIFLRCVPLYSQLWLNSCCSTQKSVYQFHCTTVSEWWWQVFKRFCGVRRVFFQRQALTHS